MILSTSKSKFQLKIPPKLFKGIGKFTIQCRRKKALTKYHITRSASILFGVKCMTTTRNVSPFAFQFILPTLAFYWTSGPWRNQWTMYGYDPRKDRGSHQYQTLDYRVRLEGGAKLKVRASAKSLGVIS